ncbi:hypothetical protein SUGI_0657150 [Cryptomeria japonica]|nr:hypothetical protein SUGI_0657150 [Cryptomeria japonica]
MGTTSVSWFSVLLSSVPVCLLLLIWRRNIKRGVSLPLPPGPPAWPIVGNLFQVGEKPHESLFALSQHYGPLMTLSLGMKKAVVVSSPEMAKEFIKTHDHIFAGQPGLILTTSHPLLWGNTELAGRN